MTNKNDNWATASNEAYLSQLKTANIRSSKARKLKKILFFSIGAFVLLLAIAIPTIIYTINKPFTITINTNVETNKSITVKVDKGSRVGNLKVVQIEGYEFIGWYKDKDLTIQCDLYEKVEKGLTLYAGYKIQQYQVSVPLNDVCDIDILGNDTTVNHGDDFSFKIYPSDASYDISGLQITVNGELIQPDIGGTYYIKNIKENIEIEIVGLATRTLQLTMYADGNKSVYQVSDNTNLQNALTKIGTSYTEYNTIGWFLDDDYTVPANLTERLTSNITIYTKTSSNKDNFVWVWNTTTSSWSVDIHNTSIIDVAIPCRYKFGTADGYATKIIGGNSVTNNKIETIYIPSSVRGIESYAFYNYSALKSVTIPNSVEMIGNSAFEKCSSLTGLTIPKSITNIGNSMFAYCSSLTSIYIPNSIVSIGYFSFENCGALESVTFESNSKLSSIGAKAFANCKKLKEISIPNSVSIIGYHNFYNCEKLAKVVIPDTVTIIGDYAFYGCKELKDVSIPNSVNVIGGYAFYGCTNLPITALPNSVTSLGVYAFASCKSIVSMTIPNSLTSLPDAVFNQCTALVNVTLADSIKSIGSSTFSGCKALKSVNLCYNDNKTVLETIGTSAFASCTSLTQITIPSSVKTINNVAFNGCTQLSSITINKNSENKTNLKTLGYGVFTSTGLINVTIPKSVTSVSYNLFNSCASLKSVTFEEGSPLTNLSYSAFYSCTSLTEVNLPENLTSIGSTLFYNCTSLTTIKLPSTIKSIQSSAFKDCKKLTKIEGLSTGGTILTSLTEIGNETFYNCIAIDNITIPSSVTNIGNIPFYGCTALTSLTLGQQASKTWRAVDYNNSSNKIVITPATTNLLDYFKGTLGMYKFTQS